MEQLKFIEVRSGSNFSALLEEFLRSIPEGRKSFRYFKTRPLSVVENHSACVLLCSGATPIAYGHLDPEGERVWLGVAVADRFKRQGHGEQVVHKLISKARELEIPLISLTVDKDNENAISLYEKLGFTLSLEQESIYLYELQIC